MHIIHRLHSIQQKTLIAIYKRQASWNAFLVQQVVLAEEIQQRDLFVNYTFFEENPRCNGVRYHTNRVMEHQL